MIKLNDKNWQAKAMQEYDIKHGCFKASLAEIEIKLSELGYKLDRRFDCKSIGRSSCGYTFPALAIRIIEADSGLGFSHYMARRDKNFEALQQFALTVSCLHDGMIITI